MFRNDDVKNFVQQVGAQGDENQHMVSNLTSVDEVVRAISNLEYTKSAGFDMLIPEILLLVKILYHHCYVKCYILCLKLFIS